jgi:viologen exporter family transport system permease protein
MNHRGGWALIKRSWASWLQYRSFFFVLAFGWMIPPLIYLFVWSTASEPAPIAGMTPPQFVAYYLILILVNQLTFAQTNWTVGDIIRMGSLNSWLLKPMSPLYNAIASEVAGKVVMMAFVVPVSIVLAIVLRPELNATLTQVVLFCVALTGAWLLRFFWGLWLACLAFWATRADALLALQDALIFLLAGVVAPVALLPSALQTIAHVLPFYYMVGFPVEVLTGQISSSEVATGFVIQTAWLIVAVAIYRVVWRSGLKRYSAIGG